MPDIDMGFDDRQRGEMRAQWAPARPAGGPPRGVVF
jgi:hypothetical protein